MQINTTAKYTNPDLFLCVIGVFSALLFSVVIYHIPGLTCLGLIPPIAYVCWLVLVKNRFIKIIAIENHLLTITYIHGFKTKQESIPVSACQYKLDHITRHDHTPDGPVNTPFYQLTILTNNVVKWRITDIDGFSVQDFLTIIQTK
ncbi:hypothetical protein [Chitinophaga sancti]|uniref:Uncharacterized protein n=1 Tax=Chitinophaga sancti TaxID=1004 RepID=A0A1K1S5V3_9BACT|nr:hypothetical protein [Chitinophaga sancti]WQD62250.1 hypothetical protein U0033_30630 [Chitinophaga sancti]WQG92181.1 hypothetical protein SR876_11755 [Chitinophaga sancti]SFW79739.1 hypothetical protein SAMN05661012_04820 [Chitinophaga sancti]